MSCGSRRRSSLERIEFEHSGAVVYGNCSLLFSSHASEFVLPPVPTLRYSESNDYYEAIGCAAMRMPMYRYGVDYLTRYSNFNPLLLFAQQYAFTAQERSYRRCCYANAIVFVEAGCGTLSLDGEEHAVRDGSLVYIPAGLPHQWFSDKERPMVHRCAYFDWHYVNRPGFNYQKDYFAIIGVHPFDATLISSLTDLKLNRAMQVGNHAQWLSHFNAFTMPPTFLGMRSPIESLAYNAAFQTFLHRYLALAAKSDDWRDPRIVRIIEQIERLPFDGEEIDVYSLASEQQLGKSYFHKLFKSETGYTPNEYVQKRRLYHAADELAASELSVTEIAKKYRYSSIHYFSKQFRKATGMSPSEFKAQSK